MVVVEGGASLEDLGSWMAFEVGTELVRDQSE